MAIGDDLRIATREDMKDIYGEGITTGRRLERAFCQAQIARLTEIVSTLLPPPEDPFRRGYEQALQDLRAAIMEGEAADGPT